MRQNKAVVVKNAQGSSDATEQSTCPPLHIPGSLPFSWPLGQGPQGGSTTGILISAVLVGDFAADQVGNGMDACSSNV